MMHDDELRVIALQGALDMASTRNAHAPIDLMGGAEHWSAADVAAAAATFFTFLKGPVEAAKPSKIQVAWRDESPTILPLGGKALPATHGAAPLVSTTVVRANPESLREMRARLDEERVKQAQLDNPTERF